MRLALFTNRFPAKVSTFFARDINSLVDKNHQIDIYTIYPVENKYWKFVPENLRRSIQENVNVRFLCPSINFRINKVEGYSQSCKDLLRDSLKFGFPQFLKSYWVILQANNWAQLYDGYYDQMLSYWGNYSGTYCYLANKLINKKIPNSFFLHAGTDLYRDQIYLEQKILCADKVFTVCEYNKRYIRDLYPNSYEEFKEKLVVYHLGIDFENFHFNSDDRDSKTLVTIGSFSKKKGFLYAIQAFARLSRIDKDLRLVMIGDGSEKRAYVSLIRKLGIEGRVDFPGWLPFEKVKEYLSICTLLIHPSSDHGDAVPTVIKEAMVSGLPVIASNIVGIPELLDYGRCGILVTPRDITALTQAIQDLLSSPESRFEMSMKARIFAEKKFSRKLGDLLL